MKSQGLKYRSNAANQRGVSLLVAMILLVILTLVGVSSMNTAIVELKMAGSMQQQGIALNRADESLRVGENNIDAIIADPGAFDFTADGDGYYVTADNIDVFDLSWSGLKAMRGANDTDGFVTEYLGPKAIPGESVKISTDGRIIGGAIHTFRITARSSTGKGARRLVQSLYVTREAP